MYCKAGVQCTNPEIYGDIKRGRRLAPSKGIVCPRCQGKCCNEACLEKHKCKQRARPSSSVQGMRAVQHARWQGLDPSMGFDPTGGLLDPNMALALARAGQGGLLLPQGGNMMPAMIPILPLPLMFNAAALQQAGADGTLDAAQLQAALAAMGGAGGMSAPMMLAPMGGPGTPTADAAAGMSQALQLAQLQQLQAAGLGGPLLQLTVQPDGSTGLVQAGGSGQRMALPQGLMQGMPLQLPQGLQLLSAEQLQLAGGDGSNGMPLMQIMADGSAAQMDQATMNAVAAAAAAGGLDGGLMAGLTAMGANLGALAGVSASDAQAFLEQQQQQLELNAAAAAAVAAAAAEGMPGGLGDAGVEPNASNDTAAAGMQGGLLGPGDGAGGLADPHAAADMAAAAQQSAELLAQQQADAAEAGGVNNPGGQPGNVEGLPPGAALAGPEGLMLPAIAPLHMQGMGPALAAALQAASGGRVGYNAEEDTAAAALMSLATDKKNKAAAAAAAARAALEAASEGIIPQGLADQAMEEARMLQAEAEAEEAAAAAQQRQAGASAGGGGEDGVKLEQLGVTDEQLQQLQLQIMQQQQMAMLQHHHNQQQALAQQVAEQQQQQEANFEQQQHLQQQQHLEAQVQQEHAQQHLQHQYEHQ